MKLESSRTTLGLCETAAQAEILTTASWSSQIDIYIATTPGAAWTLCQKNIPFSAPEDFYRESDLCAHAQPYADFQFEWVHWIDQYLQRAIPDFAELNFRPAASYIFYLKVAIDHFFMHNFALKHILDRCQPAHVVCFDEPVSLPFDPHFFIHSEDPRYSASLVPMARGRGIELTELNVPSENGAAGRRSVGAWMRKTARYGLSLARAGVQHMHTLVPRECASNRIVLHNGYDIACMTRAADRLGIAWEDWDVFYKRIDARARRVAGAEIEYGQLWSDAIEETQWQRLFRYGGFDLWSGLKPRLHFWWHTLVPELWQYFVAAREVLERERPKALVIPHTFLHSSTSIYQAAKTLAVPTVIYQHGGFMGNCVEVTADFRELLHADYMFVYGEGTSHYFASRTPGPGQEFARPIVVGSARIDMVHQQQLSGRESPPELTQKDKPIILYFSSADKANRYLNCSSLPPVMRFRLQAELFELFNQFPHLHFIYKMHPGNTISGELAHQKCPKCQVVSGESTLIQLIWRADAIIVDEPTTGMLESVLTNKKMVVYAEKTISPLTPMAKPLLEKRACVAETQTEFLVQVRALLECGDFQPLINADTSFRKAYVNHLDDGFSADRALGFLQKLNVSRDV